MNRTSYIIKPHLFLYIFPIILLVLTISIFFTNIPNKGIIMGILILSIYYLIFLIFKSTLGAITNKFVLFSTKEDLKYIHIKDIKYIKVKRGILGRILNCGDITIKYKDRYGKYSYKKFYRIKSPLTIRHMIDVRM